MIRRSSVALLLAAGLLGAGACSSGGARTPTTLHPHWHEVVLPTPSGTPGRIVLRDAIGCAGTWYVVGAIAGPDGSTRPAAWSSADGTLWRNVRIDAHQYYARRAVLYSVACRDGTVAVLGARSGGAHANPRTMSWHQRADGTLEDVSAPFELFGGPDAIAVTRVAAGARGWMIAGTRTTGAVVWASPDAGRFRLVDRDRALSSDQVHQTSARDVVDDGTGWTAVGDAQVTGRVSPTPMAWTSTDGLHWRREVVPAATAGFGDLERVVRVGDVILALGLRGQRFGAWERTGGGWRATASFGRLDPRRSSAPAVTGLAVGTSGVLATANDGVHVGLWARDRHGRWQPVATPVRPLGSGERLTTVAALGDRALLVSDDGTTGRVWLTTWNTLGS